MVSWSSFHSCIGAVHGWSNCRWPQWPSGGTRRWQPLCLRPGVGALHSTAVPRRCRHSCSCWEQVVRRASAMVLGGGWFLCQAVLASALFVFVVVGLDGDSDDVPRRGLGLCGCQWRGALHHHGWNKTSSMRIDVYTWAPHFLMQRSTSI